MPKDLINIINSLELKTSKNTNKQNTSGMPMISFNRDCLDENVIKIFSKEIDTDIYHFKLVMNRFNYSFYPYFFLKGTSNYYFEESIVVSDNGDDEGDHEDNVGLYLASLFGVVHDGHVESILVGPDMNTINKIIEEMINSGLFRADVRMHFLKTHYGIDISNHQLEFKSRKSLSEQIHKDLQGKTVKTDSGNTMPAYDHLLKSLEEKLLLLI